MSLQDYMKKKRFKPPKPKKPYTPKVTNPLSVWERIKKMVPKTV
jgi:hypothetical protein